MKKLLSTAFAAIALAALPLAANAITVQFNANLGGANEVPPNAATGTGIASLLYDDQDTLLTTDDTYDFLLGALALTGVATAFHIHAPAPASANGPVVVNLNSSLFTSLNVGGNLVVLGNDIAAPNASFLSNLSAGLAYVNVHTSAFPGGEIRGQLLPVAAVPEPATYALFGAGLGLVGLFARRRAIKGI